MNTLYRIYTEDINRDSIIRLCSDTFESFTVLHGTGVWNGNHENSLVVEVIGHYSPTLQLDICLVARGIKELNNQQAILVTKSKIDGELV